MSEPMPKRSRLLVATVRCCGRLHRLHRLHRHPPFAAAAAPQSAPPPLD